MNSNTNQGLVPSSTRPSPWNQATGSKKQTLTLVADNYGFVYFSEGDSSLYIMNNIANRENCNWYQDDFV